MNFNAHSMSVSAYMTLMFTSAFMTLNLPGPLSFAAAGAGLEAVAGRLSVRFEAMNMPLPAAPSASIQPMAAGELKKAADKVESGSDTARLPAAVAQRFGLNDGSQNMVLKSSSTGTVQPRDIRGIQVARVEKRRYVVFVTLLGSQGTWYLTDEDGIIRKAVTMTIGGPVTDVPTDQAETPFGREKSYWLTRLEAGEVLVGQAGS